MPHLEEAARLPCFQHGFPIRRHDRLRMELDAVNRIFPVLDGHDLAVHGAGRDSQAVRDGFRVRRQRVITGNWRCFRTAPKQRAVRVKFHIRLLAVHQLSGIGDGGAKSGTDGLMTQADP